MCQIHASAPRRRYSTSPEMASLVTGHRAEGAACTPALPSLPPSQPIYAHPTIGVVGSRLPPVNSRESCHSYHRHTSCFRKSSGQASSSGGRLAHTLCYVLNPTFDLHLCAFVGRLYETISTPAPLTSHSCCVRDVAQSSLLESPDSLSVNV